MKLLKLNVKNIRSYENGEIIFPDGSFLLSGNVGSGKTTLLLAIEYALFGLQAGQKASALLRNDANEASVVLECEISGNNVVIERGLRRGKISIASDYAVLTINNNREEYSTTELKSRILELLGYPSEFLKKHNLLYKYTIYTPQEQMKQIIVEDAESRLSILRSVFGIDKYKTIRENLVIVINKLKDEIKSLQLDVKILDQEKLKLAEKKARIIVLEKRFVETETLIQQKSQLRKIIEKEASEIEEKLKEKSQYEKEVEKASILISSKKESLASNEKELAELQKITLQEPLFNEEEYFKITEKISAKKQQLENLHSSNLSILSKLHSIEEGKNELLQRKQRVFSMKFCPTCLQDVPEVHKHNILNETESKLSESRKNTEILDQEKTSVSSALAKCKSELNELETQKSAIESLKSKAMFVERSKAKILEFEKTKSSLLKDIEFLEKHILSLKEQVLKFSAFDIQAKRKLEELKRAFTEEKNAEITRAEVNKELELTHAEISQLSISISAHEKAKQKLDYLFEMSDWLASNFSTLVSHIETNVMLKLRMEFSKLFSSWFSMIVSDSFEMQLDESFTPLIIHRGIEMDYSFLSGGERTAVALAYRLALAQTINSVLSEIKTKDLLILDEPTEGFSEAQIDRIRDVLEQLKISQLIIVSHEQKVESFVDHVIRIQKQGNVSKILQYTQ